jgi:hypothetical protein
LTAVAICLTFVHCDLNQAPVAAPAVAPVVRAQPSQQYQQQQQQQQQSSQLMSAESLLFAPHVSAAAPAPSQQQQLPAYVSATQALAQQQQPQQPSLSKDMLLSLYAPQPMAPSHQGQPPPNPHGTGFHGAPNYHVHLPTQQNAYAAPM